MMLSLYHFEAVVGNRKLQISARAAGIHRADRRNSKQGARSHRAALRRSI